MTSPGPQSVSVDMGRVVQRTAEAAGQSAAGLFAELGMAREAVEAVQTRNGELEQQLAGQSAELARVRAVNDALQARVAELEAAQEDGAPS